MKRRSAFTLVEILTVLAVISLLAIVAVPAVSMSNGFMLTRQGQILNDQLVLARQMAMTRNRDVELRFIQTQAGSTERPVWALQIWQLDPKKALSNKVVLSDNIVISQGSLGLSPILDFLESSSDPGTGDAWRALRYRPNGRTFVRLSNSNNYLTLKLRNDGESTTGNFYTLQVNSFTGRVSAFRP